MKTYGKVTIVQPDPDFEWDGDCEAPEYPYIPYMIVSYADGKVVDSLGGVYLSEHFPMDDALAACIEHDIFRDALVIL